MIISVQFFQLAYHCRSLLFLSQRHMAEHLGDDHTEWFVDVYPKGVWFQRCLTVYWPPGLEVNLTGAVFIWLVGRWFKMAS